MLSCDLNFPRGAIRRGAVVTLAALFVWTSSHGAVADPVVATVFAHKAPGVAGGHTMVTFGQPFAPGEVRAGASLSGRSASGRHVPAQFDPKSSHADGSVRFGVVTLELPSSPSVSSQAIELRTIRERAVAAVTLEDLAASGFDAEVSLTVDGRRYGASALEALRRQRPAAWLEGPLVTEWVVGGPVRADDGRPHPHLAAYFHVRAYGSRPVSKVRVDVVLENGWSRVPSPTDLVYDATISIAGRAAFSVPRLTHFHHARWHRVLWWGGEPEFVVTHQPDDLQRSLATPRYASLRPSAKAFEVLPVRPPAPMENLDLDDRLGRPGAAPWIGPMPRWDTLYAVSGDVRALMAVIAYADAWSAYPVHYRDEKTGQPIDISAPGNAFAGMPGAGRADFPRPVTDQSPYGWKSSHSPPAGFMAYLVTGDYFYLEQLQFVANQNLLQEITVGTRRYPSTWPRVIHSRQVRAQAWTLRTLGLAAAYSPDRDPLKPYFSRVIRENLGYLRSLYPVSNSLGMIVRENVAFNYDTLGPNTGFAPWQHNFYTFAIGRLVELGFDDARPIMDFVTRWHRGVLVGQDFCWVFAVRYEIGVRPSSEAPLFRTFREVYEANIPESIRGLGCGSRSMAEAIGKPKGAFDDYLDSPTSYQANQQPAVAMMATLGIAGGNEAWQLISTRSHRPRFDDYPNFAVVPRGAH